MPPLPPRLLPESSPLLPLQSVPECSPCLQLAALSLQSLPPDVNIYLCRQDECEGNQNQTEGAFYYAKHGQRSVALPSENGTTFSD